MQIEAVDLFCGVGGLTAGLIKSGIKVKAGYDVANECRFAYEHNNHDIGSNGKRANYAIKTERCIKYF